MYNLFPGELYWLQRCESSNIFFHALIILILINNMPMTKQKMFEYSQNFYIFFYFSYLQLESTGLVFAASGCKLQIFCLSKHVLYSCICIVFFFNLLICMLHNFYDIISYYMACYKSVYYDLIQHRIVST